MACGSGVSTGTVPASWGQHRDDAAAGGVKPRSKVVEGPVGARRGGENADQRKQG